LPASATFSGVGNTTPTATAAVRPKKKTAAEIKAEKLSKAVKQCRKDKAKKQRAACEKTARKQYGAAGAKKKPKKSADRKGSK
jgi:hypothetical protein